ncbi:hypothetical protein D5S18_21270 [Nocardia panacis]|uniref:Secreted protein n=1 Tax=Nocardia panacis TaxID=2340916 RepID=A0A3A4KV09_9NOCA|nr:hypothetical protein [Nocardia panacis]RJO73704.1 hypothetical protein D5S18_21270 [Nocardia panacis]
MALATSTAATIFAAADASAAVTAVDVSPIPASNDRSNPVWDCSYTVTATTTPGTEVTLADNTDDRENHNGFLSRYAVADESGKVTVRWSPSVNGKHTIEVTARTWPRELTAADHFATTVTTSCVPDGWAQANEVHTMDYATKWVLSSDPSYLDPKEKGDRLDSPFGVSTRIACSAYRNYTLDCWQADREGKPHKLIREMFTIPGKEMPAEYRSILKYTFPR